MNPIYINFNKRKVSPQKASNTEKKQKTNDPLQNNPYRLLVQDNAAANETQETPEVRSPKPPPIFLREVCSSALVTSFTELIGKNNFHIVQLRKGGVNETKTVTYTDQHYREITKYLTENNKNFYTYQLKSSKGLKVVIKGIDSSVEPSEIKEALEELGYHVRSVANIFNKNKNPQPMFRVELEPDNTKLKKNETHPIYSMKYLIHRRITVEEPLKRNGPVQCMNCQEFGHTKSYCKLRSVCVACGDLHSSSQCQAAKQGLERKCGNCGGNHSANYRGCPVYKELLKRLREKTLDSKSHAFRSPEPKGQVFHNEPPNYKNNRNNEKKDDTQSYANVFKKGLTEKSNNFGPFESCIQALSQNLTDFNQNMAQMMSSMQNTMQELLKAQNQMLQILLSKI